jgi:hypothetical protein
MRFFVHRRIPASIPLQAAKNRFGVTVSESSLAGLGPILGRERPGLAMFQSKHSGGPLKRSVQQMP